MKSLRGNALLPIFFTLAYLLFPTFAKADKGELVFGIYPYLSPSQIVEQFTPLGNYLSEAMGQPVTLRSAPNFEQFIERTHAGEYDIIFTAPHMGRHAEKQDGYRALAQSGYQIVIVALTKKDSPIKTIDSLRDKTLAVGAKMSMTYQIMNQTLANSGLELGKNVKFIDTASFSNVLEAILRGEADAGATGTLLWDSTSAEQREQLREIYRSQAVPGFLLLGHPRNDKSTLKKLQQALFKFGKTPDGEIYFSKTRQIDFRPLNASTMKRIDPYTAVFNAR